MDINQIDFHSPDWLKALLILTPFVTAYAIARLTLVRRQPFAQREPRYEAPVLYGTIQTSAQLSGTGALPLDWDDLGLHFLEARMSLFSEEGHAIDPALVRWAEEKRDEILLRLKPVRPDCPP